MDAMRLDALEGEARRVLPPAAFAYYRQGARDGVSAAEAVDSWSKLRLVPRVLREVAEVAMGTTLLGAESSLPLGVAPTSLQRAADPRGEIAMASACASAGVPLVLSSNATATFADLAETGVTWWLQAYLPQDRELARPMLEAAVDAGAGAVVLTVDTPVVGTKYDHGEGVIWDQVPPEWVGTNLGPAAGAEKARDLGPADVAWLADVTELPVVPKGVLDPEDARRAVDAGAAALWVSNHGGRQLDRVATTADCLARVVEAVDGEVEVYVDGGIRSGLSVLTALALGARACFLGRLPLYALAAAGEDGVRAMFTAMSDELDESLRLAGCADLDDAQALTVLRS
jgi:4-hydroxymandelate oxidase